MKGIDITALKIIEGDKGNVMHALKSDESSYADFGEAYFSTVDYKAIKGWKKHTKMVSNLIVPKGKIRFIFFDDRDQSETKNQYFEVSLSLKNYVRITVQPGIWMAFQGKGKKTNMLLNISSIKHDPAEAINVPLDTFKFKF